MTYVKNLQRWFCCRICNIQICTIFFCWNCISIFKRNWITASIINTVRVLFFWYSHFLYCRVSYQIWCFSPTNLRIINFFSWINWTYFEYFSFCFLKNISQPNRNFSEFGIGGNLEKGLVNRYTILFPYKPDPMPSFFRDTIRSRIQNWNLFWGPQKFLESCPQSCFS